MTKRDPEHGPRRRARGARRLGIRLVLLAAGLGLALFLAEFGLWLLGFPRQIHEQVANPPNVRLWVDHVEFQYQWNTNDQGLRYRDIPRDKPHDTRRVFVVGDSFTDGEGVTDPQRFTELLERRFDAPDRGVQFINAGLGGQGVLRYARLFYWIGLRYQPDALLICVNVNDVSDISPGTSVDAVYSVEKRPLNGAGRALRRIWPRLWARFREARDRLRNDPHTGWEEGPFDVEAMVREARLRGISPQRIAQWRERLPAEWVEWASNGRLPHYLLTWGLFRPAFHTTAIDIDTAEARARWQAQARLLTHMVELARRHEIEVGVVFLPNLYLYDPRVADPQNRFPFSYLGGIVRAAWLDEQTEIQRRLARWSEEHEVPLLDLTTAFRSAAASGQCLHYDIDGHWNAAGHRLAADSIRAWIEQRGLFDLAPGPGSPSPPSEAPVNR